MSADVEIRIVIPATDEGAMSGMLRRITKAIDEARNEEGGYGLGGAHGYGARWDTPVFMMKPYCWCDRTDCAWCAGCECEDARGQCSFCTGDTPAPETGAIGNRMGAPNFWHKPSGLRVWWYKYIGRGVEIDGEADLLAIERECIADVAQGGGL